MSNPLEAQIRDTFHQLYPSATPRELNKFVDEWITEEKGGTFKIGCPDFHDRPTLILLIEAARALCGMQHAFAFAALREATKRPVTDADIAAIARHVAEALHQRLDEGFTS